MKVRKQPSLEWRCVYFWAEIMAESRWWVSNVTISILLKKGWFPYVIVSLKRDEYHIYMAQLPLQSLYTPSSSRRRPIFQIWVCKNLPDEVFLTWFNFQANQRRRSGVPSGRVATPRPPPPSSPLPNDKGLRDTGHNMRIRNLIMGLMLRFHIWFIMTVCYKMRQILLLNASDFLLQNATDLLQNATVITTCDRFITKCDSYYKIRQYTVHQFNTYYIYWNKKIHLFTHNLNYFSELYEVIYGPGTISFQERSSEDVLSKRFS